MPLPRPRKCVCAQRGSLGRNGMPKNDGRKPRSRQSINSHSNDPSSSWMTSGRNSGPRVRANCERWDPCFDAPQQQAGSGLAGSRGAPDGDLDREPPRESPPSGILCSTGAMTMPPKLPLLLAPLVAAVFLPIKDTISTQDCRRTILATRNRTLDLAADYLNALGPDRPLTAFEAARAVRALKQDDLESGHDEWCRAHVCPICDECDCSKYND